MPATHAAARTASWSSSSSTRTTGDQAWKVGVADKTGQLGAIRRQLLGSPQVIAAPG